MNLKQKLFYALAGFLLGNFILASAVFGFKYYSENSQKNISLKDAIYLIENNEIKEVNIISDRAELVNHSGIKLTVENVLEAQREFLISAVTDFNKENQRSSIKVSESPKSFDPLSLLFQILFWLFFISPPVIALLLFLIWRELRERNKLK